MVSRVNNNWTHGTAWGEGRITEEYHWNRCRGRGHSARWEGITSLAKEYRRSGYQWTPLGIIDRDLGTASLRMWTDLRNEAAPALRL